MISRLTGAQLENLCLVGGGERDLDPVPLYAAGAAARSSFERIEPGVNRPEDDGPVRGRGTARDFGPGQDVLSTARRWAVGSGAVGDLHSCGPAGSRASRRGDLSGSDSTTRGGVPGGWRPGRVRCVTVGEHPDEARAHHPAARHEQGTVRNDRGTGHVVASTGRKPTGRCLSRHPRRGSHLRNTPVGAAGWLGGPRGRATAVRPLGPRIPAASEETRIRRELARSSPRPARGASRDLARPGATSSLTCEIIVSQIDSGSRRGLIDDVRTRPTACCSPSCPQCSRFPLDPRGGWGGGGGGAGGGGGPTTVHSRYTYEAAVLAPGEKELEVWDHLPERTGHPVQNPLRRAGWKVRDRAGDPVCRPRSTKPEPHRGRTGTTARAIWRRDTEVSPSATSGRWRCSTRLAGRDRLRALTEESHRRRGRAGGSRAKLIIDKRFRQPACSSAANFVAEQTSGEYGIGETEKGA
jgi:hypothetical protein